MEKRIRTVMNEVSCNHNYLRDRLRWDIYHNKDYVPWKYVSFFSIIPILPKVAKGIVQKENIKI